MSGKCRDEVPLPHLYPRCDSSVWLRSCEQEVCEPIYGHQTGNIPSWLSGTLIRNGPGSLIVGDDSYKHLFDSAALLHRFRITDECVTYQCKFLRSRTFKKNRAAQRIVVTEFGTTATAPDPCHTIFDRVSAIFHPGDSISDNAMISVYPFCDEVYAFTEGPVVHRIDPQTLDTVDRRDLNRDVALLNHTSHPHVDNNGNVYNLGMTLLGGRIRHVVVLYPAEGGGDMFSRAKIVGKVKPRWLLHPSYMHSFGITERYFVLVEQPLCVSIVSTIKGQISNKPLISSLKWYPEHETHIVLISRTTGKEATRFRCDSLFFLHVINAFEQDGDIIVDVCSYKDPSMLNAMYVDAMKNMQSNAKYAEWFRARPRRIRASLSSPSLSLATVTVIADIGAETPRINYTLCNGRQYRYFYAISSDVDAYNPGTLVKVDTVTGEVLTWCEEECYPSEPVYVPQPNDKTEDSGVLLSAVVWGGQREREVGLVVLRAEDLVELARTVFILPSAAPKCLHGWFWPDVTENT